MSAFPVFAVTSETENIQIRRNVPTEFEMSNDLYDIKYYTSSTHDEFYDKIRVGNEILTSYDFYKNSKLSGTDSSYASVSEVSVENQSFTKATRLSVTKLPTRETTLMFDIGTNNLQNGTIYLNEDATYLLSFSARLVNGGDNQKGLIKHQIQEILPEENDLHKKALFKETELNTEWNTYYLPFKPVEGYTEYKYSIRIGYMIQDIDIADLRITYQGTEYTPDNFPTDIEPKIHPTLISDYEVNKLSKITGDEASYGSMEIVDVTDQTFTKAIRLKTNKVASKDTKLLLNIANKNTDKGICTINDTDVYVISFYARLISGGNSSGYGVIKHQVQETVDEENDAYTKAVFAQSLINSQWKKYYIPFKAVMNGDGEYYTTYKYAIRFGYNIQEIELADLKIINCGSEYDVSEYPVDIPNQYPYLTENQQWRNDALQRIEKIRKGDFKVVVKNQLGYPVKNARVELDMFEHQFPFGSCVSGVVTQKNTKGDNYRKYFAENFNAMVHETVLKWGPYESDRDKGNNSGQTHIDILKELGVKYFRGHQLVWEKMTSAKGTALTPERMRESIESGDRETFDRETEAHIKEVIQKFPDINEWDVLNEEVNNRLMRNSFNDELIPLDWLQWAREYSYPDTKLVYNETQYVNSETFYSFLDMLKTNNAQVDMIGLQSHYDTCEYTPEQILETYSKIKNEYGYDVKVTEFSCGETFYEELQASYTRDMLIAAFSHEAVKGFLFWGFYDGSVYATVSPFYTSDWKLKEAGKQFQDLVYNKWWTKDEVAYTDNSGEATFRGFYGNYDVTVSSDMETKTVEATFFNDTTNTLEVTINETYTPDFTQNAHSFIYSGKVVVEGKSDYINPDFLDKNYLHNAATLLLIKKDGNNVSPANILSIQQTNIDEHGNYRFEFIYDGFEYAPKEEISNCYIVVNINGNNATDTIISSDIYPNCLSLDLTSSIKDDKITLDATITNLVLKSGLDYTTFLAFYNDNNKMLGLKKVTSSLTGNEKDKVTLTDISIPEGTSNAKIMFWINNLKLTPLFGAQTIDKLN